MLRGTSSFNKIIVDGPWVLLWGDVVMARTGAGRGERGEMTFFFIGHETATTNLQATAAVVCLWDVHRLVALSGGRARLLSS